MSTSCGTPVREFVAHYDAARPHRGLKLATPIARVAAHAPRGRTLGRYDVLGGIIHEYEWAA